jgi:hypothetical protein
VLANAITDWMNARVPWLWWPLDVPREDAPLPRGAHVLYAVHGAVLWGAARAAGVRVGPRAALVLGAASWWWFTAAWNARATRRGG